jgi:hypothetical protein
MKRTTILAEEGLLVEAKHLAQRQGKTLTALFQEALRDYIRANRPPRRLPDFVGMGRSDDPTVSQRVHEILAAEVDPIEGLSPRRYKRERLDASGREHDEDCPECPS